MPKQHLRQFSGQRAKQPSVEGRSPPQELEVGPRNGPYLIVNIAVQIPQCQSDGCEVGRLVESMGIKFPHKGDHSTTEGR